MNHQEITTAFETIYTRCSEVHKKENEWIDAERARLQGECEQVGHIWGKPSFLGIRSGKQCVVCHKVAE